MTTRKISSESKKTKKLLRRRVSLEQSLHDNRELCLAIAESTDERCKKFAKAGSKFCHLHEPKMPDFTWKDGVLFIGGIHVTGQLLQDLYEFARWVLQFVMPGQSGPIRASDIRKLSVVGRDISENDAGDTINRSLNHIKFRYQTSALATDATEPAVLRLRDLVGLEVKSTISDK